MKKIKKFLWAHPLTTWAMSCASFIKNYLIIKIKFEIKKLIRLCGIADKQYEELKRYKEIHNGERCFILATGPSLTLEDVSKLRDEITFGMNSICFLFNKLGWETTYYGIQDPYVFAKLKPELIKMKKPQLFIGDGLSKADRQELQHIPLPIDYMNHSHTYKKLTAKFTDNIYKCVYDGYTITYTLIQLAAYMGFKKIYLLGNDCTYASDPKKQHFMDYGHSDPAAVDATRRILFAYEEAKRYSDAHGFTIYNATRGGALEIFQRVNLDEVLGIGTDDTSYQKINRN